LVLASCGRVEFASVPDASPTSTDGAMADAFVLVEPAEPWGAPLALVALNTASEDADPELRADGLELLFHSNRAGGTGGYDLYQVVRATTADPFGVPTPIGGLNTVGDEVGPTLSADGLVLYFSDGADIVFATRPSVEASFGAQQPLPGLSSSDIDTAPEISGDGLVAIVVRGTGDTRELWMHTRISGGSPDVGWSAGEQLTELSSAVTESSPNLDRNGLVIYFHSDRGGGFDDDIYVATRATTGEPFGVPSLVGSGVISTTVDEGDPTMSADRRILVFHRQIDLYMSMR
jgi:Tol biopolymer transport system component